MQWRSSPTNGRTNDRYFNRPHQASRSAIPKPERRSFWSNSSPDTANPLAREGSTGLLTTHADVCIGRRRRGLSSLPNGRNELARCYSRWSFSRRETFVRISSYLSIPFGAVGMANKVVSDLLPSAGTTSDTMMSPMGSLHFLIVQFLLYKRHTARPIKGALACFITRILSDRFDDGTHDKLDVIVNESLAHISGDVPGSNYAILVRAVIRSSVEHLDTTYLGLMAAANRLTLTRNCEICSLLPGSASLTATLGTLVRVRLPTTILNLPHDSNTELLCPGRV